MLDGAVGGPKVNLPDKGGGDYRSVAGGDAAGDGGTVCGAFACACAGGRGPLEVSEKRLGGGGGSGRSWGTLLRRSAATRGLYSRSFPVVQVYIFPPPPTCSLTSMHWS